jgi:uncharacterized protein (DUF2384 family)
MTILSHIEEGVTTNELRQFQQDFKLPATDMSFLMVISRKGYYNLLTQKKLNRQQTERFLAIREVYEQALETLEKVENIHKWMHTYHAYLKRTPFEVMDTYAGCAAVKAELIRLDHGIV